MLNEEDYDYKTDVYSFGIVLYSIFLSDVPKQSLKDKLAEKLIDLPEPSMMISKCCLDLIKMCLVSDHSERPSFDEIIDLVRKNSYQLAPYVDIEIVYKRDNELKAYEK